GIVLVLLRGCDVLGDLDTLVWQARVLNECGVEFRNVGMRVVPPGVLADLDARAFINPQATDNGDCRPNDGSRVVSVSNITHRRLTSE
ncbi:hypothetical protein BaRGS_00025584, partial [Batillaria attramentaria]